MGVFPDPVKYIVLHECTVRFQGPVPYESLSLSLDYSYRYDGDRLLSVRAVLWRQRRIVLSGESKWEKVAMIPVPFGVRTYATRHAAITADATSLSTAFWPGRLNLAISFLDAPYLDKQLEFEKLATKLAPIWRVPSLRRRPEGYEFSLGSEPSGESHVLAGQLRKTIDSRKLLLNGLSELKEEDFPKTHLYSLGNTNYSLLRYCGDRILEVAGHRYRYRSIAELPMMGNQPIHLPLIDCEETLKLRGESLDVQRPWPVLKSLYDEWLEIVNQTTSDVLPWSPVYILDALDQDTLEPLLKLLAEKSAEISDIAFFAGQETWRDQENPNFQNGIDVVLERAFRSLRWSPNNLHALACAAVYAARGERFGLALDLYMSLILRLHMLQKILETEHGTPTWYAARKTIAWHYRPAVVEFSQEPAYIFGLYKHINMVFPQLDARAKRLQRELRGH